MGSVPVSVVVNQIGSWHIDCIGRGSGTRNRQTGHCEIVLEAGNLVVQIVRSQGGAVIAARIGGCTAPSAPAVRIDEAVLAQPDRAFRFHQAIVAAANRNYPQCLGNGFIVDFDRMTIDTVLAMTQPKSTDQK